MVNRLIVVNFGAGKAGLLTVGYALYNRNGSAYQARTTSGVFELGTSTGIYAVDLGVDATFNGLILWDTGDSPARYGTQETLSQLNAIQDGSDLIRLIWNSLRNQGELYQKLLDKLGGLKGSAAKDYDKKLERIINLLELLDAKPHPTIEEISRALTITVNPPEVPAPVVTVKAPDVHLPAPIVNIPRTIIPDYTRQLEDIKTTISRLRIPDERKLLDAIGSIDRLVRLLDTSLRSKAESSDVIVVSDEIKAAVAEAEKSIREAIDATVEISKIEPLIDRLVKLKDDKARKQMLASLGVSDG